MALTNQINKSVGEKRDTIDDPLMNIISRRYEYWTIDENVKALKTIYPLFILVVLFEVLM